MIEHRNKVYTLSRSKTINNFMWCFTCSHIHSCTICKLCIGKFKTQLFVCSPTSMCNKFPRLLLTISVWPSIWVWKTVENFSFVPIMCQSVPKVTREFHISIEHNDLRQKSCNLTTPSKNILATLEASAVREQERIWTFWKKRSTITKTESCFLKVFSKPNTKSILTFCQGQ